MHYRYCTDMRNHEGGELAMKITVKELRSIIKEEVRNLFKSRRRQATKKKSTPNVISAWRNPASGGAYLYTDLGNFYFTPYNKALTPVEPKDVPKNLDKWPEIKDQFTIDMMMISSSEIIDAAAGEEEKPTEAFSDDQQGYDVSSQDL